MSCQPQVVSVPATHVFARKDATNWTVVPLTSPLPATDIARVMSAMRVECITGNLDVQFGYRTSADMLTWSSFTTVGSDRSADGLYYETSSTPIDDLFVQFGVQVKNTTGTTACDSALVSLSLELSSF